MAQRYQYNRIDLATDAIRLVRLLRGDQGEAIECEIFETYLHQIEGVPYEALSYVWGIKRSEDMIWLDGCLFEVTKNLYEALVQLRRPEEDRVLWIDAICIDQSHNAIKLMTRIAQERGHQVGQMRLIYQTAQRVIVWLGSSNLEIDFLFDWMIILDRQMLTIPKERPHTISTWETQWLFVRRQRRLGFQPTNISNTMKGLILREWFSRIWVLQEAALAKSAMITCGQKEVNSRTFVVMPSLLGVKCSESEQSRLDILPGLFRAESWWSKGSGNDLLTLLQRYGGSKASDPRDIIYALLGLSGDTHSSEFLQPDYQVSLEEAIQRSVAYFMIQTHDLPRQTPVQLLPKWDLNEFLASLGNLSFEVFRWASDNAQDLLLHDLLVSQRDKQDAVFIDQYLSYSGSHGSPIAIALKKENVTLMKFLMELMEFSDADVDQEDSNGATPLSIAAGQGNKAVMDWMSARRQIDAHWRETHQKAPLWTAINERIPGDVQHLFYRVEFDTPLLTAVRQGDLAVVEETLRLGKESTYLVDSKGDGLLNIAARRGDESVVDLLLQRSTFEYHSRLRGSDGLTPFESALVNGSSAVIKRFLACDGQKALHSAVKANQFDFLGKILDVQPRLADECYLGFRPALAAAAWTEFTRIVVLLLDKGAEMNLRDDAGLTATPLWIAAARGNLKMVKLLVERGADIELTSRRLPTREPFNLRIWPHPKPQEFSQLVNRQSGRTTAKPIWMAASLGYADVVRFLIQHGADIDSRDSYYGLSPFWRAAQQNQPEVMRVLIEGGANVRPNRLVGWGRWHEDAHRHPDLIFLKDYKVPIDQ